MIFYYLYDKCEFDLNKIDFDIICKEDHKYLNDFLYFHDLKQTEGIFMFYGNLLYQAYSLQFISMISCILIFCEEDYEYLYD